MLLKIFSKIVIVELFLIGLFGCTMEGPVMGGPNSMSGMPEGFGKRDFRSPFSVVYEIDYDEESFPYIKIYYNIPYSGITFLKEDSLYKASFRLNFNVIYEGETIVNKGITENIKTRNYSKTISSKDAFFGTFRENISTGENEVSIMIIDKNSDRRYVWKHEILVPEISDTSGQD